MAARHRCFVWMGPARAALKPWHLWPQAHSSQRGAGEKAAKHTAVDVPL